MKHRYVTALVSVAALVALACEGQKVPSDRDPDDRQVDPVTAQKIVIKARSNGPYEVVVNAYDAKGGREGWREPVASGFYRQTLEYTSGIRVRVTVSVKSGASGDGAWCAIVDGLFNNTEDGPNRNGRTADCELTSTR